jgi:RNA polymerase sigma-70 factor (ECF subfamily)
MGTATIERHDYDLAVRFRDGDPEAIREVYRVFSGPVFALCRSMLADSEHARDAVQQTFLQAWRAADRFDPQRPLSAWLYKICRRVCIDRYRRERRATEALTTTGSLADVATDGPSLERTWTTWEVRRAIDCLPEPEREIVRLAHLEGWSLSQIAHRLDVPIGTIKSRSHRAHRRLVESLAHLAPGMDNEERVA